METPLDILRRVWGYPDFRPAQREIIDSVLAGRDTLGLLPTGGGKSLTFQVPALLLPGVTLVVTPLISLMKDQVDNLAAVGVRASAIHSGLTRREITLAIDRVAAGASRLLYVSPERLASKEFMSILAGFTVSLLVVDEAHCISQWGYDFRPSYLNIAAVRSLHPGAPVLALTASAPPEVARDIVERLRMERPACFSRSFARPNISYLRRRVKDKQWMLLRVLGTTGGSAIVYVRSRKRTVEIARMLCDNGIDALAFHAGMAPEEKAQRQNLWKEGRVRVMVATNAFGMGIDKPDVRVVAHVDLPSSLEEYYQEAGRAGRDGQPAFAVLITADTDKALLMRRLSEAFPPKDFIARVYDEACVFLDIPMGEGYNHTYEFNLNRFIFQNKLPERPVKAALGLLTRMGYMEYADDGASARAMMLMRRDELYGLSLDAGAEAVLQALLRTVTGLFADYVPISEDSLVRITGLGREQVYEALLALTRQHVLHYIPPRIHPYIFLPTSREEPRHLIFSREVYELRREAMERRLKAMRDYAFSTAGCCVEQMLRYFGDPAAAPCGRCDHCREAARLTSQPSQPTLPPLETQIRYLCAKTPAPTLTDLIAALAPTHGLEQVVQEWRRLHDAGQV